MKKWMAILLAATFAVPAMAQLAGLPIAGGAVAPAGKMQASAGVVVGDDFNTYGVRGSFAPIEGLGLFGDAGLLDPDGGDMGWAVQGGGLFVLPLGLPVDLGLRGALGFGGYDVHGGDATLFTLNGGLLASKTIEQFTPYAFAGLNYFKWEVDVDHFGSVDDDETDLAIAGGVSFALTEQISIYGEIAHIDDVFFGFGGRFGF